MPAFVPEDGAVDALLSTTVDEFSPDEERVTFARAQYDLLPGACKERADPAVLILVGAVMALIEFETCSISVFGKPPKRPIAKGSFTPSPS